jgi:hypothetical protein
MRRGPSPVRRHRLGLMRLKRRAVGRAFVNGTCQPVLLGTHGEGQVSWFGTRQAVMVRQQTPDQRRILRRLTAQRAGQTDHSHSMVPGGFEVMS